jgi:type I restriction enzyme, S subunit
MAPEGWIQMSLGDFVTLQRGHDLPAERRRPGSVPVLGSFGITGWHDEAKASGPGVTVGRSGASFGVVSYSPVAYWPLNTALYVTDFHGNDHRFAYYFLKEFDFRGYNSGSAQPSLNRNFVHPAPVDVPPLPEQRAIAHILGTLDDKIELNRRMNETLEAMARALFKSWFVDFDPVRAKAEGRDPGLPKPLADLFPARLVDSEMGEIPEGWRVDVLQDVLVQLEVGGRPKGGVSTYTVGVPSVGAESIVGLGIFDYSKTKYVPREFFDGMRKGRVRSRDVLLYKDGGRPGEFEPHVTMVGDGFPFDTCVINEHVYRLRANQHFGQNLLFLWLSSELVMEEMRVKGTGVAIPGLNSRQVRSLTTLVPTPEVARTFDAVAEPWIARVLASCKESRTLAALRDTLLPKLISGELRIQNAEKLAANAL